MEAKKRALTGGLSGIGGTLALTGFRNVMHQMGLVFDTAPEKVVSRLEELGLLGNLGPEYRQALAVVAHFGYGVGAGTVSGLLRGQSRGLLTEASVGAALGILVWGAGWSSFLPLLGVDWAPWDWESPDVLLPVVDHAAYGAFWGVTYWAIQKSVEEGWI